MAYSKEQLQTVIANVIGEPQREALGLPRATEEAAITLFLCSSAKESEVLIIRQALVDLRNNGAFNFTNLVDEYVPGIDEYTEYPRAC